MEQVLIRAEIFGENAAGQKHIRLLANNTEGIHFWTDDKSIVRAIEPEQLPFIVEPEPCRIPFSTMQRVCKHRRTGGIVYGGDAKPRDACHYEMYRSLWDECSMRNCPILNRREIE